MDFRQTYRQFIFSSQFMVVYLLTLTQSILIGFFQVFIKTETYNDQQQLRVAFVSFLVTMIFAALLKVYCSFHMGKLLNLIEDEDVMIFTKRTFVDWVITEVRAQIRMLIGFLLFIIPGIIEAMRLSLAMPFVFYDKRMEKRSFDPIIESREILHMRNPVLLHLFGLIVVAPLLLFFAFQNGSVPFFQNSLSMLRASVAALAFALFTAYTYLYFAFLYQNAVLKNKRESDDLKELKIKTGEK